MEYAIEATRLGKRYARTEGYADILTFWRRRHVTALRGVDLRVHPGMVFGLLGPNGAGKTTLLKILSGLVLPDAGRVIIHGIDVTEQPDIIRKRLAYVSGVIMMSAF